MDHFNYQKNELFAEQVPVRKITEQHGTPCYIYSKATIERHWQAFDRAFANHPHLICYAVKANSNLAILNLLAGFGSGFDIVSIGELERVLAAGAHPEKIVFSGVGKKEDELTRALEVGIRCFNVEVSEELDRLNRIAGAMGKIAPVSLRVNPDVDAKTHPYIATGLKENKFGLAIDQALIDYRRAAEMPNVRIVGLDCHIGSQLVETAPFLDALDRILKLAGQLADEGIHLQHLDLGGGLGIRYQDENPPNPSQYIHDLLSKLQHTDFEILLEPGRAIVGNAGILVTRVEYIKPTPVTKFAIVDAAMNDLIRPSLYNAWQDITPVNMEATGAPELYDIVGPVCETGDFLGKQRLLKIQAGDLLAIRSSGAYGFTMSSNYNSRPRAAEVMVDDDHFQVIRDRETISSLWNGERILE
ncbi:MAG: diaminopimelate decarboxylase [Methylococcaceae bacterium]